MMETGMSERGMLVLEDGSTFIGKSVGAPGEVVGEVVFSTGMSGYQEAITDPSFWGQMVVFTCPHIGNVGVNAEDVESDRPYVRAVLVRKMCERPSNWRSQQSLPDYLKDHGIPALSGLDTRALTLALRDKGIMRGAVSTFRLDREYLLQLARSAPDMSTLRPVREVTISGNRPWTSGVPERWKPTFVFDPEPAAPSPHVVVIDCGNKQSVLRHLVDLGARVTVVPATATSAAIVSLQPDGVLVANGPGDPDQVPETVAVVRELLDQVPIFGICLGYQLIALASGARCYKLPFGHHGGNHPVQELATGRVEITVHNHNYSVDPDSLEGLPLVVTHVSLSDGTIEGLRHTRFPAYGLQYHPEASPGPHDALHVLREFVHSLVRD